MRTNLLNWCNLVSISKNVVNCKCAAFLKKNMPSLELQVELETCTQNTCANLGFARSKSFGKFVLIVLNKQNLLKMTSNITYAVAFCVLVNVRI